MFFTQIPIWFFTQIPLTSFIFYSNIIFPMRPALAPRLEHKLSILPFTTPLLCVLLAMSAFVTNTQFSLSSLLLSTWKVKSPVDKKHLEHLTHKMIKTYFLNEELNCLFVISTALRKKFYMIQSRIFWKLSVLRIPLSMYLLKDNHQSPLACPLAPLTSILQ